MKNNRIYFYLLYTFIAVMVSLTVFSDKGLIKIYQLSKSRDEIRLQNKLIKMENESLKEEIQRLKTDNRYIEEIARKELGLVGPKEVIYRFEK